MGAIPFEPGGGHCGNCSCGGGGCNIANYDNVQGYHCKEEESRILPRPVLGSGGVQLLHKGHQVQDS
jgi:hypothetical protein